MSKKTVWRKAIKKPIIIEFREVKGEVEKIKTEEGILLAIPEEDFIIRGVNGEIYPIKKEIFYKTYEVLNGEVCTEFPCNIKREMGQCSITAPMCLCPCEDYWSWELRGFWIKKKREKHAV